MDTIVDSEAKCIENSVKWFHHIQSQFLQTAHHHSSFFKTILVAKQTICLWFANSTLADIILPAIEHLIVEDNQHPDFTIGLFDSDSTKTPTIAPPWPHPFYSLRGEVSHCNNARIYSLMDPHTRALSAYDKEQLFAVYWVQSKADLPWWAGGSPLQYLLHWMLFDKGYQLTHAAAIANAEGAVLLAGKSGSGKSTTTLNCLKAGFDYLSEDYCLIEESDPPMIYSVYNSAKLEQKTLDLYPNYQPYIVNKNRLLSEKALIFQHAIYPNRIKKTAALKAIMMPTVVQSQTSILQRIETDEIMAALAISTMWQLVRSTPATFARLKQIAKQVPCYRLLLGQDFDHIPILIGSVL